MRLLVPLALAVASVSAAATAASVTLYSIQSPDTGSCRLKGIDDSSDNFKFYASVAAKDLNSVSEGCARCIKVTKDGAATSLVAYVLDVCQGCKSGDLKLSTAALSALSIDPNLNNATASYKFTTCPTSFQSGTSVKACLMEGASNTYIPLQFYNSQKVIASANISGVVATQPKDQFFFASNPQVSNADTTQWFKEVPVILTSTDGETKSGSFAFGGTTGCATSSFQFSAASTADGNDSNGGSGGSSGKSGNNTGVIVGAIAGCVAALIIIIGSVIFVRRRRANHDFENGLHDDPAQQYLSPTAKPHAPPSPERPTYADTSMHNSTDDPSDGPESPTHDWDDASTPAASAAMAARNPYGAGHVDQYNAPPPQPQPTYPPQQTYEPQPTYIEQQQQRQVAAAAAPKVAHQTVIAPQTFSYSKPVDNEHAANNSSFRSNTSSARAAPTFPAPVLPKSRTQSSDDEDGEGRSSFDIDDLRETEELKSRERFSSLSNDLQSSVAPHSSESAYATGHVTSPQSYVRATTLRRNSSKVPERPAFRFTSSARSDAESLNSSGISERDSYASDRYHGDANAHPNTGSFRDTSSGYSRESLGILGYPYAKKPSGRSSTEAQL